MRTPLTFAVLVLVVAGVAGLGPASANQAAETCMGKPVTITDLDGGTVQGTDGDDVILTVADVTVLAGAGHDTVCVQGTDDADYVDVQDGEDLEILLGDGFDTLHLSGGGAGTGTIDSGVGKDYLQVVPDRSVLLDLRDNDLSMDGDSSYVIAGEWDVTASAKRVRLLGDVHPNHLRALDISCHVTIEGRGGKDWLAIGPNTIDVPDITCANRSAPSLYGLGGDDLLVGWTGNDRLFGGPGRDTAKGGFGRDTCRAEVRRSCER